MSKKKESPLELAPLDQAPSSGFSKDIAIFTDNLPEDEQRILDECGKEVLVMDGNRAKTIFAIDQIAEIHKHSVVTFEDTTAFILAIKDEQLDGEQKVYMDEFCIRSVQVLGRHIFSIMEVGAANIGKEVHRSLYPPIEQQKPKGFLQKLFG